MNADIEGDWVPDYAREAARQSGGHFIDATLYPPDERWVSSSRNGGPWMRRRQRVVYCDACRTWDADGPDWWTFCPHRQRPTSEGPA